MPSFYFALRIYLLKYKIRAVARLHNENHNYLIEEIRKLVIELQKHNWTITFTWTKAHVGIYGNKLADKLAKEATIKDSISFKRIPKSEAAQQLREQSIAK